MESNNRRREAWGSVPFLLALLLTGDCAGQGPAPYALEDAMMKFSSIALPGSIAVAVQYGLRTPIAPDETYREVTCTEVTCTTA